MVIEGLASALLFFVLIVVVYGYYDEKHKWNDGICKENGLKWKYFDIDSSGARGYTDNQGAYIWISFKSVDKNYKKE